MFTETYFMREMIARGCRFCGRLPGQTPMCKCAIRSGGTKCKPRIAEPSPKQKQLSSQMRSYYRHLSRNRIKKLAQRYSLGKHCRCGQPITNDSKACRACAKRNPKSKSRD